MQSIIKTTLTNCKDCYKCLRHCSVKAIKISAGHAQIDPERCILDGKCVQVCPQEAKKVTSYLDEVKALLSTRQKVVLSLAPSFPAVFSAYSPLQLYQALLKMGFVDVEETAIAAYSVANHYKELLSKKNFLISSDCPSVVNLIEIYYPHLLKFLAPVVSPMIAHSMMLRQGFQQFRHQEVKVVFVGPCIAKIGEAEMSENAPDYVLSFLELQAWMKEAKIDPLAFESTLPASEFDDRAARLYPLEGGLLQSVGLEHFDSQCFSVTGFEKINNFLSLGNFDAQNIHLAELLCCDDGCLNGPLSGNVFPPLFRNKIFEYNSVHQHLPILFDYQSMYIDLSRVFRSRQLAQNKYTEEQITEILKKTGRDSKENQLNCGACGYYMCRDKAIAVLDGMAEVEMCFPYMKKKAESRADIILERSPNGVIELTKNFEIIKYNTSFQEIFALGDYQKNMGKNYREIIDVDLFPQEQEDDIGLIIKTSSTGKQLEIRPFAIPEEDILVAIITDITQKQLNKKNLDTLKKETIDKTTDVIHRQMRVAQEIASLLGETTAETKATLLELMNIIKKEVD